MHLSYTVMHQYYWRAKHDKKSTKYNLKIIGAVMHIVAQLRSIDLLNFQAKYQRVVSFWVPVNYTSLNELVSMPELERIPTQFRLPPIQACVVTLVQ
jgi:hypothetical protein